MTVLEVLSAMHLSTDSFVSSLSDLEGLNPRVASLLLDFKVSMGCMVDLPSFLIRDLVLEFFRARVALRRSVLSVMIDSQSRNTLLHSDPYSVDIFSSASWTSLEEKANKADLTLTQSLAPFIKKQKPKKRKAPNQQGGGPGKKSKGEGQTQGFANRGKPYQKRGGQQKQQQQQNQSGQAKPTQNNQQPFRGNRKKRGRGAGRGGRGRGSGGSGDSNPKPKPPQTDSGK